MGDTFFIRTTPYKHIIRFERKGKLTPRYINPYEIMERVSNVAYMLALSTSIDHIHNMLNVSSLCKYVGDLLLVLKIKEI